MRYTGNGEQHSNGNPLRGNTPPRETSPSLASLFLSFLNLGATAFGGPAMVPYIGKMTVEQRRWLDEDTFRNGVALCQTIPGATAMQTAAYVGMFGLRMSPIIVIILAGLLGLMLYKRDSLPTLSVSSIRRSSSARPLLILLAVTACAFVLLFLLDRKLFDLAAVMFRIDLFAFGGGFASVPLMYHEIVEVRSWMDAQTFLNGIALGQITPGPIVITATFVGYMIYGLIGAVVATASVFLPCFLILIGAVPYFDRVRNSIYFARAIRAILCSFVGLLLTVTFRFASNIPWDFPRVSLAAGAFVALLFKIEIIWIVLAGTVISVFFL
jgi:chromate transporter